MKNIFAIAAFAAVAAATTFTSNRAHFVDTNNDEIYRPFDCDVHQGKASTHFNRTIAALHRSHAHSHAGTPGARNAVRAATASISVPLYMHVITKVASAGSITQAMVGQQLVALNTAYGPSGISFSLRNVTFTANDAWAVAAGSDMTVAKTALRQGTYGALNLYLHTDLSGGILGTCTLPSSVPNGASPSAYIADGCNVNAHTMPGGTFGGYNQGKTAVHETGHWLGLLHTFEGYSCTGAGDSISDTPPESVSTNGCPSKPAKDSCASIAGVDPIHNYMDYSTDACYTNFTPGQAARMASMWTQYRAGR